MRSRIRSAPILGLDHLRNEAALRRRRRRTAKLLALGSIAAVPALSSLAVPLPRLLVWNASASAPRGLYLVVRGSSVRTGDLAIAWPPAGARALAARRGYLPANVPLVKRIAAAGGDRICTSGRRITIDGRTAAIRLLLDAKGRAMPHWSGCRTLGAGQYLLLADHLWSFDGRYFGVTGRSEILGRARLLWPR